MHPGAKPLGFKPAPAQGPPVPSRPALLAGDAERFVELLDPDRSRETPPVGGYFTLPAARLAAEYSAMLIEVRVDVPAAREGG